MSTPLHTVKDRFGSKEALIAQLMPLLDRQPDETNEELQERLTHVSNRKLMRLWERAQTLRDKFGTREALVDRIVELKLGRPDAELRSRLLGYSTGRLLSTHWGLNRAAKR